MVLLLLLLLAAAPVFEAVRSRKGAADVASVSSNGTYGCGSCDDLQTFLAKESWDRASPTGVSDVAVGTPQGTCCRMLSRAKDKAVHVFSASKMITGHTLLKLVDEGLLDLDAKVADILDWWNAKDQRSETTVRHLMSMTAGMGEWKGAPWCMGNMGNEINCAQEAYHNLFEAAPGTEFRYTEASWYVLTSIGLKVTKLGTWNEVFHTYLAGDLGVDPNVCYFALADMTDSAADLWCTADHYGKMLTAITAKTLFKNSSLYDEAERPHTVGLKRAKAQQNDTVSCREDAEALGCKEQYMPEWSAPDSNPDRYESDLTRYTPGLYWHYGLCQWTECATPDCQGGILRTSSRGFMGTYPWVDRGTLTGNKPHWGVVVRSRKLGGEYILQLHKDIMPKVAQLTR